MTSEQLEGNKIIIEFMGFVVKDFGAAGLRYNVPESNDKYYDWLVVKNCQYHSSWDWLMAACEKFDNLQIFNPENWQPYANRCNRIDDAVIIYDINETFRELVQGIKWYNQNC